MYSKIALNNVKKSFKDYTIYFLTLTLSVCIFYSFNSIESQKAIIEIGKSDLGLMDTVITIIGIISLFVSFVLGSLILYANNFLIKKRKKEFGIYMSLGMGTKKISKILVLETFFVGLISLLSGIVLGIIFSQGLSLLTSQLFDISMNEYIFTISFSAILKTVLYFSIIFVLVIIFNTFIISRYKIIDMLTASRKNESIKLKNHLVYIIAFIIATIFIIMAYIFVIKSGLDAGNLLFIKSIILGVLGTFLIFFGLAGFGLNIIKRNKSIYFKNLNIFILKQLSNKINTNFISMSVICLMLFLTIGMLSTGISFKNALEKGLENNTPFDASAKMNVFESDEIKSISQTMKKLGCDFDENEEYIEYTVYNSKVEMRDLFKGNLKEKHTIRLNSIDTHGLSIITISDYNKIRKLDGKDSIDLNKNEALIISNNNEVIDILNNILEYNKKLSINNINCTVKNSKVITDALDTSGMNTNKITLIINDSLLKSIELEDYTFSSININYSEASREKLEEKYSKLFKSFLDGKGNSKYGFILGTTKKQAYLENKGMTTVILFVGIYLGIVFLISSMAVLSLQQLSEASDSIDRYKSLKRIGATDSMINRTIFIQTLIYFTLPLGLAFIHSVVAIYVITEFIKMFGKPNIGISSIATALIFILVYLGYFYSTYTGYKNIVKNSD
ncbi:ABC transporter permease [Romboutsia lituseburensis]|uniref:ABC transporter permease n=1 Tax=Romboutsia lituseburensis TaxID=1537 RepID=UPI00215B2214|nr:ABC transporter permease [Romboutsia lituseburensis]MCR8746116.1 ABC transporter permease [Romboutsia lituseburensis]